ncbi:MAG: hypothetical protein V9E88_10985 [Ferruginibacter sp.]
MSIVSSIVKNSPNSMMAVLLSAMKDAEVPIKKPMTRQDTIDNYNHYKKHYWDGVTFMDERIIRTPFFLPKLERYYREVIPQAADSIIADADYKMLLARTCPEMYKFLLNWLTDEYINPIFWQVVEVIGHPDLALPVAGAQLARRGVGHVGARAWQRVCPLCRL